jgi:hypothetical protein
MSEEGCEIRYRICEEKQIAFSKSVLAFSESKRSETDAAKFKLELDELDLDTTYVLSYEINNCGFIDLGNSQYEMYFTTWGMYWGDVMLPMLHQLGAKDIFAYVHDTSWGGDFFARCRSDETEYLYISHTDAELDSFLYDERGGYIGTSFDELYNMFLEGKFKTPKPQKPDVRNLISDEENEKAVKRIKDFPRWKGIVFLASLTYLIWYFLSD